jgi:hypothetical protein
MFAKQLFLISSLLPLIQAQETVLGVYIFHRHGDRTSKNFPPTSLTDLGYYQVYASGDFYRKRYIESNASSQIFGISPDLASNPQLNVQAPVDTVLQNSAAGFLQGLYPPVGATLGTEKLANGTSVEAPLNGFQLIPVNGITSAASGSNSENSAWLQGQSGCNNAIVSSNDYFFSQEYINELNSTMDFYHSVLPVINGTFSLAQDNFKNSYLSEFVLWYLKNVLLIAGGSVYDLVHVSMIHNQTIPSDDLLTPETVFQLQTLADNHEYNLGYNASEPIRAVAGSVLAAQMWVVPLILFQEDLDIEASQYSERGLLRREIWLHNHGTCHFV